MVSKVVRKSDKPAKSAIKTITEITQNVSSTLTLSSGGTVNIKVCNASTLPDLLNFLGDVADDLGLKLSDKDIAEKLLLKLDDISYILKLIAKHSETIYSLTAAMSDVTVEQIRELEVDDLLALLTRVAAVNKDFFIKRVLPLFVGAGTLVKAG
jgi:hypothetical protein